MRALTLALLLACAGPVFAAGAMAVVMDDIGYDRAAGERAVALPVTIAVLPGTPHASHLASAAHAAGREVIIHLPMEPSGAHALGPHALTTAMAGETLVANLRAAIHSVPHARGLSNHMGSKLTARPTAMTLVMRELRTRQMFFLDSRTTAATVAARTAASTGVPNLSRDVFLDPQPGADALLAGLKKAVELAREPQGAVVIAHPYPQTLTFLEATLPHLDAAGITFTTLENLLQRRDRLAAEEVLLPTTLGAGD